MATIGDLVVNLGVNSRQLTSGLNRATGQIRSFANRSVKALAAFSTAAVAGIGAMAVKLAADAEQTKISFEVLTGSADKARELIGSLRTMAAKTPFEFVDLAEGTKTLMQFGVASEGVLKDLDMLSNIASGNADRLGRLSLVYGQISSAGRLMGQDLLQLINVGFNPLNQISKRTGETMMELRDRMSAGKISFQEVRQAFVDATSAGGLFYKMNEKQSQTLLGRWSTLKDEISLGLIELGESIIKNLDLKGVTKNVSTMVAVFKEDWIPAIEQVIALAPKMIAAFGQIGQGVGKLTQRTNDWLAAWERITIKASGFVSGVSQEDMHQTLLDMGIAQQPGVIPIQARTGGKSMLDVMPHTAKKIREREEREEKEKMAAMEETKAFEAQIGKLKLPAEQMLAGFIRDGIAAVGSGLMSLGPAAKDGGPKNQVGSLEKGSQEAFEVMRANVGAGGKDKVQEKQLAEAQKQTKLLGKLEKKMTGPEMAALQLKIMGIED